MISKQDLKELAEFQSKTSPVLSVYLNVDTAQRAGEQYRLTLRGMLKSVADQAASEDIKAVERYVDLTYDGQGRGLAIFSAHGFWRAYPLTFPVGDGVYVAPQPYIKPLADFFDAYDRYGVVLVDREGARLFLFNQGVLEDATGILGEELKEYTHNATGRGGRSGRGSGLGKAPGLDSRIDRVASRNLRDVVDLTQKFYAAGRCERIILGGTEDNRARFMSMLPKILQSEVIGTLAIDMYASPGEVLERSANIIQGSVAERKAALVENLVAAARTGNGSLGLSDTLVAMQERRVQTLVIEEGFSAPGYACEHCSYLALKESQVCPICGGTMHLVQDIVDLLIHRALAMDLEVVFVRDEALEREGSIGAVWRF